MRLPRSPLAPRRVEEPQAACRSKWVEVRSAERRQQAQAEQEDLCRSQAVQAVSSAPVERRAARPVAEALLVSSARSSLDRPARST